MVCDYRSKWTEWWKNRFKHSGISEVKQKLVTLASIITLLQIETRVQAPGSKPSEIALRYESGSDQVCSGRSSKTELLFSCGNSLGAPVFVDDRFVQLDLVNYVGFN